MLGNKELEQNKKYTWKEGEILSLLGADYDFVLQKHSPKTIANKSTNTTTSTSSTTTTSSTTKKESKKEEKHEVKKEQDEDEEENEEKSKKATTKKGLTTSNLKI